GGETRQDYKDPRRFPLVAPSCALLFLPFGLPVSFRCYGRGLYNSTPHNPYGVGISNKDAINQQTPVSVINILKI
ncbi:hypothetical protein ACVGWX_17430, partial [Enterobacter hormaechei]